MKTNELSQDNQTQATKDSFNYEEWKAGFKFDTPEFLAEEAARKEEQLADIRMEEATDAHRKAYRPRYSGDEGGVVIQVRSLTEPDWSENHEA